MSNQYIILRRSSVPGKIPNTSSLELGEIAINTYDGLIFMKKSGSQGEEIISFTNNNYSGSFTGSFLGNLEGTSSYALTASYTFSTGLTNTAGTITSNLSTGISGGQSVIGGTASGNNLTLSSTSHATKGKILFGTSAYDEVNNRLGIGTTNPAHRFTVKDNGDTGKYIMGVHTDDDYPWLAGFFNDQYSTSVPVFEYFGWSNQAAGYGWTSGDFIMGNPAARKVAIYTNGYTNPRLTIDGSGNVGIGTISPTAVLHLKAGTATANTAPLKFTTGTNTTVAVAGQIEYNNTFHLTNSDATRRHIVTAPNTTKVTASAPYTNDGYIVVNIAGTDFKILTTA